MNCARRPAASCWPSGETLEPLRLLLSVGRVHAGRSIYLFLAKTVRIVQEPKPVGSEQINGLRKVTVDELLAMIARNEITASVCHAIAAKLCARSGQALPS